MPFLAIDQVDDFLEAVLPKYERTSWKDISKNLQKFYFAERLFNKANDDSIEGDHVNWKLQINNPNNFKFTGLYADDTTNRVDMLTHGEMKWATSTVNYTYDITESVFRGSKNQILNYIDVQEHGMYNDYFEGMERAMFSDGPVSSTQSPRLPSSLTWWIQPYNTASGYGNNSSTYQFPTGTTSGFLGMNPYGFTDTGGVDARTYSGWRNRVGTYANFTEDDAIDTIVESMDKCQFTPAHTYSETAPTKSNWELLTTYSRVKAARKLAQAGNDNLGSDIAKYKGAVFIHGAPLIDIPAWWNQSFGLARTDGLVLGVNWSTFKYYFAAGLRQVKRPPYQDKDKHNVRWRVMDDAGQIVCFDRRQNFAVTCTSTVTEQD